jgi:hypothetical protein
MRWDIVLRALFIILLILFLGNHKTRFREASRALDDFRAAGGDYQRLRKEHNALGRLFTAGIEAKRVIPPSAPIDWSLANPKNDFKYLRYALYPVVNRQPEWDYFIDANNEIEEPDPSWSRATLSNGVTVYAKQGAEFLDPDRSEPSESLNITLVIFGVVSAVFILTGVAGLCLLRIDFQAGGRLWFLSIAYLLGLLVLNLILLLAMLLGYPLTFASISLIWLVVLAILLLATRRRFVDLMRAVFRPDGIKHSISKNVVVVGLVALCAYTFICLMTTTALVPVKSHDALSHWIYKAKILFYKQRLDFTESHVNEYPILWPLTVASQFTLRGADADEMAKWMVVCLNVAFIFQLRGGLQLLRVSPAISWLVVLLYLECLFERSLTLAYAEACFMAFLSASLSAAMAWQSKTTNRNCAVLMFIMMVGLAFSKFEGSVAVAFFAASMALVRPIAFRNWAGSLITLVVLCLPAITEVLWFAWGRSHGFVSSLGGQAMDPISLHKLGVLIDSLQNALILKGVGFRFFAGAFLVLLLGFRMNWLGVEMFLAMFALLMVAFSGLALLGWPESMIANKPQIASPRLFLHATPPLLLLFGSLIHRTYWESPVEAPA